MNLDLKACKCQTLRRTWTLKQRTTYLDSSNWLTDQYVHENLNLDSIPFNIVLAPCISTPRTTDNRLPVFGKQLTIQPFHDTSTIVHWISPQCILTPGDIIKLTCPGCAAHTPLPVDRIRFDTTEITSPYTWADLDDVVRSYYYYRLDVTPDFSAMALVPAVPAPALTAAASADLVFADSPIILSPDSYAGFYGSIASHTCGTIKDWPSFLRAEAAAVYAALTVTPPNSTIKIYTDSQTAIDGLHSCASSTYMNSRIYYKTTNFELWAIIERQVPYSFTC
ncbi:unnamed protein product [Rhizophagus irregularis]|nr:unnamed protein product [Rhizophagus irregularis]